MLINLCRKQQIIEDEALALYKAFRNTFLYKYKPF